MILNSYRDQKHGQDPNPITETTLPNACLRQPSAKNFHKKAFETKIARGTNLGLSFSTLATILNLLQNWSPFSPRFGNNVSSFSPRMIGCSGANLTADVFLGRAKTGAMGVIGGCSGCGVLGTVIAGDPRSKISPCPPAGIAMGEG